ncbi:MAG: class I SAM-dependent methyltransferase [Bacteroidales bacterium]|jgi:SAM-dependent methyltransferase
MEFTGERYIPELKGEIELEHYNRYYFVLNQVNLLDKIVLDLASGEGYGSNLLAEHSKYVYGVDISPEAVEHAKSKYLKNNLVFLHGEAENVPLKDKSTDLCVSFETIEHLENHEAMMAEIKRVLKPDGILIISSPDKYNYSELPHVHNTFHKKELYFEEFKALIKKYFIHVFLFDQRIFVGSIIALRDNYNGYKKPMVINKDGSTSLFNPVYNIAIATDSNLFKPDNLIVLYNESDFIISKSAIQNALQNERYEAEELVRNSLSYRLGSFIIKPIKKFLKLIKLKGNVR